MTDEKPLHVQVAEALGWIDCKEYGPSEGRSWVGTRPDGGVMVIPHYDANWSATGPLIEKYLIDVTYHRNQVPPWTAYAESVGPEERDGETPLKAVCNLILALAKAGRL